MSHALNHIIGKNCRYAFLPQQKQVANDRVAAVLAHVQIRPTVAPNTHKRRRLVRGVWTFVLLSKSLSTFSFTRMPSQVLTQVSALVCDSATMLTVARSYGHAIPRYPVSLASRWSVNIRKTATCRGDVFGVSSKRSTRRFQPLIHKCSATKRPKSQ